MKKFLRRLARPLFAYELGRLESADTAYQASSDRERSLESRLDARIEQICGMQEANAKLDADLETFKEAHEVTRKAFLDSDRARLQLEVSNASLQHENEFLREQVKEATLLSNRALQTMANIHTQSQWGVKPFPDAPGLPDNIAGTPTEQPEPKRVQGLDMVNEAKYRFLNTAREKAARGERLPIPLDQIEAMMFS